jgi:hypothetical protein
LAFCPTAVSKALPRQKETLQTYKSPKVDERGTSVQFFCPTDWKNESYSDSEAEIKQTADAKTRLAACVELRKTIALARDTLQAML